MPKNTLESLEQAALLGCNVVEIDLRRTLDGEIVLNHDGLLERLTDGTGTVEDSFYAELAISDAGGWMGERFAGLRIARFDDALRLARKLGIQLVLDIKTPGIGKPVLEILAREGMLERVEFNGEWADIKKLRPQARDAGDHTTWLRPPVTAAQVLQAHGGGKAVVANFSDNPQEMDVDAMKAAVAAGVDAINVDFPRLGAEAVGRPAERTIAALIKETSSSDAPARSHAILQLARYQGFPLRDRFVRWLEDSDPLVSRAAALALLKPEYKAKPVDFALVLKVGSAAARANAAWALGKLGDSNGLALLAPLLTDSDDGVCAAAFLAVSRIPGTLSNGDLRRGLSHTAATVRGAAALALAQHPAEGSGEAIEAQLRREMNAEQTLYTAYNARRPKSLSTKEIALVTSSFRSQMQMVEALGRLPGVDATAALERQAFRPDADFSQMNEMVSAFELWDRIGADPRSAAAALGSSDPAVADRAEWMLLHAGTAALPTLRAVLQYAMPAAKVRAVRIVSMAGDVASLPLLQAMCEGPLKAQAVEAIQRIEFLNTK